MYHFCDAIFKNHKFILNLNFMDDSKNDNPKDESINIDIASRDRELDNYQTLGEVPTNLKKN